MTRWFGSIIAAAALTALLTPTGASADPDELMPCKIVIIKAPPAAGGGGLTKFVCKGTYALPSAGAAPTGGYLGVGVSTVPPGNLGPLATPGCTGLGNPAGSKGYKCAAGLLVPVVLLKTNVVKGIVKADLPLSYGSTHPYTGDVAIKLFSTGVSDTKNYCARFAVATALKNDATQFKAKDAPAPAACSPSGAFLDTGASVL